MPIKVIDLYSGNDFKPENLIRDGYIGVIFKAGQGGWADVPRYQPNWWKLAKDYGLKRGWYWLCDSRHKSADHIKEMKKWNIFADVGELGLWVDVEKPRISMTESDYWATPYAGHKNLVDFVYLIETQGVSTGIYTGPGAYELVMRGAPALDHEYISKHKLWTAQYPRLYVPGISKPSMYGKWTNWEWWQYREGPDVNIYNGTSEQFEEIYGKTLPTIPEVQPINEEPGKMKGVAKIITNIKPMAGGVAIAQLQAGDYVFGDYVFGNTDVVNFSHYYKASGAKIELGKLCKAYAANLVITNELEPAVTPPPDPEPTTDIITRKVEIDTANGKIRIDGGAWQ